jgi:hypothetical protein
MVPTGWIAFGTVVGWWLADRPPRRFDRTTGWLMLLVAAGAGLVAYANAATAGLLPVGAGLLAGAAAHALFRALVRLTTNHAAAKHGAANHETEEVP